MVKEELDEVLRNLQKEVETEGPYSPFAMEQLETLNASEVLEKIFYSFYGRVKGLQNYLFKSIDSDQNTIGVDPTTTGIVNREEVNRIHRSFDKMNDMVEALGRIALKKNQKGAISSLEKIKDMDFEHFKRVYGIREHPGEVARKILSERELK